MSKNDPNPLNLLDFRKLEIIPEYFEVVDVRYSYNMVSAVDKWIEKNLKGRYAIKTFVNMNDKTNKETVIKVGFENPSEASFFVLACPLLKYNI